MNIDLNDEELTILIQILGKTNTTVESAHILIKLRDKLIDALKKIKGDSNVFSKN